MIIILIIICSDNLYGTVTPETDSRASYTKNDWTELMYRLTLVMC